MIIFTDRCLSQIAHGIAAYDPEVGGALLKLPDTNIICEFVADTGARTSAASYLPSAQLTDIVRAHEKRQSLHFAGVIHSHPGRMTNPSGQDYRAFALNLALNPHLAAFVAPIVTIPSEHQPLQDHQHALPHRGVMTVHVCYRKPRGMTDGSPPAFVQPFDTPKPPLKAPHGDSGPFDQDPYISSAADDDLPKSLRPGFGLAALLHRPSRLSHNDDPRSDGVDIFHPPVGVLSLDADMAALTTSLQSATNLNFQRSDVSYSQVNGSPTINLSLDFDRLHLLIFLSPGYPFTPPLALISPITDGETMDARQLDFAWPIGPHDIQLRNLAEAVIAQYDLHRKNDKLLAKTFIPGKLASSGDTA